MRTRGHFAHPKARSLSARRLLDRLGRLGRALARRCLGGCRRCIGDVRHVGLLEGRLRGSGLLLVRRLGALAVLGGLLALLDALEACCDHALELADLSLHRRASEDDVVGAEEGLLAALEAEAHLPLLDVDVEHVLVERRGVLERQVDPFRQLAEGLVCRVERDLLVLHDDGDGDLGDDGFGLLGPVDDLAGGVGEATDSVLELRVGEAAGEVFGAACDGVTHGDSFQDMDRMSNCIDRYYSTFS